MVYIYGLVCPISGVVRYIGKSVRPEKRLQAHIGAALRHEYKHHTARWLRKLAADGLAPTIRILQELDSSEDWRECERAWIRMAIEESWPITNATAGGEGLDYLDPAEEAVYRANHRAAMRRLASTPAGKALLAKMKAASMRPDVRKRAAESIRNAYKRPECKQRLREAMEIARSKPGFKEKQSIASKGVWKASRAKIMEAFARPETKAKQSDRKRASWRDPATRERMMNRWTPEARELQAKRVRERHALIQSRMTPEVRARQAQSLKATWAKRKAEKR